MDIYRQGDVLLIKVKRLPMAAQEEKCHSDRVNVAGGTELPAKNARVWNAGTERFVQVMEQTTLSRGKHDSINLASGVYKVVEKREYTPKEIKHVFADAMKKGSRANSAARNFALYGYKKAA
jgi:hypothetical protein